MHIRKGDEVVVLSGVYRGKRGRVLRVLPDRQRAIVEGVNMVKRHSRGNPRLGIQPGIVEQEAPIHVSNLLPVDPETHKPTRVGYKFLTGAGGRKRKIRIARRSGVELDR
ncbi:MAG: 50S ribosomal protein L24 [Acidobacteria bacterium]|nr:MAG: 50S ribosomal protein L24 [Acidobacteriota bacterium]